MHAKMYWCPYRLISHDECCGMVDVAHDRITGEMPQALLHSYFACRLLESGNINVVIIAQLGIFLDILSPSMRVMDWYSG